MVNMNREDVELIFYNVIKNQVSIVEFEKWLYNINEDVIDNNFGENFYLQLISINYKNKFSRYELEKFIYSQISFDKFELSTLKFLLKSLINGTRDMVDLLEIFYDLYCKGYYFLRSLGLIFVLYEIDEIPRLSNRELWDESSFNKKRDILNELSPKLVTEAKRILEFLDNGLIKIIDEFKYEDLRKDEDKIELNG